MSMHPQAKEIWSERHRFRDSRQEFFTTIPSFFHVSHEARAIACRLYGIPLPTVANFERLPRQIFVRPGDTILIANHKNSWQWLREASNTRREEINSMAITETAFWHTYLTPHVPRDPKDVMNEIRSFLPNLRELVFLPGGKHMSFINFGLLGVKDCPSNLRDRSWRLQHANTSMAPQSFFRKNVCKHRIFCQWIVQFLNSDGGHSGNIPQAAQVTHSSRVSCYFQIFLFFFVLKWCSGFGFRESWHTSINSMKRCV